MAHPVSCGATRLLEHSSPDEKFNKKYLIVALLERVAAELISTLSAHV